MSTNKLDTQSNISPYDIPKKIWSKIEEYFITKYGVEVSNAYPQKAVNKPTIVWRIFRRIPGGGKDNIAQARGASFYRYVGNSDTGYQFEEHMQQQRVVYEFAVFGTSSEEVEEIAWNLENAILQVVSVVQSEVLGFSMVFSEQVGDSTLMWKNQDELMVRTLRFEAVVPIKYIHAVPQLRMIEQEARLGSLADSKIIVRSNATSKLYVPVDVGKRVVDITRIVRQVTSTPTVKDVDYKIKYDDDNVAYIEWTDNGVGPSVGEQFRVDYILAGPATVQTIIKS